MITKQQRQKFIQPDDAVEVVSKGAKGIKGGPGSGNFGHEGRPGLVGGSGSGGMSSLARRLSEPDSGFTVQPVTGEEPQGEGNYAVSVSKGQEKVIDLASFAKSPVRHLAQYAKQHRELLRDRKNYFGAWHDPSSSKIFLDISRVVQNRDEAARLGREHNQLAYYDFGAGQSVEISKKE